MPASGTSGLSLVGGAGGATQLGSFKSCCSGIVLRLDLPSHAPGSRACVSPLCPSHSYELRVIIWNTDNVILDDVNPVAGEPSSDTYVKRSGGNEWEVRAWLPCSLPWPTHSLSSSERLLLLALV